MHRAIGLAALVASGLGFPLTQAAIASGGRRGAVLVAGVTGGLPLRDVALLGMGTHRRESGAPHQRPTAEDGEPVRTE